MEGIKATTEENIKKSQEKQQAAYVKRVQKKYKNVVYKVGDEVLLANIRKYGRKGGRMEPDFSGPYTIETISGKIVTLKNREGAILRNKYNISHLKPYRRSSQPTTQPTDPFNDPPCVERVKPTLRPQQSLDKANDPEVIKHNLKRPSVIVFAKNMQKHIDGSDDSTPPPDKKNTGTTGKIPTQDKNPISKRTPQEEGLVL